MDTARSSALSPMQPAYWNERYGGNEWAYGLEPNAFLKLMADRFRPASRILVPGDGEGRNGVWLARQGYAVTTVDMSAAGCEKARGMARAHGVSVDVICADLDTWAWPRGSFDGVASIFLHLPPSLRISVHRRMRESLAPGGIILVEAFSPDNLPLRAAQPSVGGPGDAAMLYTLEILKADFAPLALDYTDACETDLAEGQFHVGRAAVVRVISGGR